MTRRHTHVAACALALASVVVAMPARAQWRAEAAIAARATPAGVARTQAASAGMATDAAAAWPLARRGALGLELVGSAAHERVADRDGGDARTALRVSWSRAGRAGLTLEGGGVLAWRASAASARAEVPTDTGRPAAGRDGAAPPRRVRGASSALGAWARVGRVQVSTSARATTAGAVMEPYTRTHETIVDSTDLRPRFDSTAGRWVSDTVHLGPMTRYTYSDGERRRPIVVTDVSMDAVTAFGPVAMSLAGGVRHATMEGPGERWASLRATYMLHDGLGISLQAARLATDRLRALPARAELQLGVTLRPRAGASPPPVALPASAAPVARRFAVEPLGDGRVTLVVHAPGARSVELMGDFTAWRIVALERGRGDRWHVTLAVASGVHQVNLRVDGGAWAPPPGLGVGDDGFGGTFGLLVL